MTIIPDAKGEYAEITSIAGTSYITIQSFNDDMGGWTLDLSRKVRDRLVAELLALPFPEGG